MKEPDHAPVFAVCGYSGAGKTTLILDVLARLRERRLRVLVVKHDTHGLDLDRPGKDTDRFFTAGADVWARDPAQGIVRTHRGDGGDPGGLLRRVRVDYDVVLVEGHKESPIPNKIWLRRTPDDAAPESCGPLALDLGRDEPRVPAAMAWIEATLDRVLRATPTRVGILIGGKSSRMGAPKHLLKHQGRTWLAHAVRAARHVSNDIVLLGAGDVPPSLRDLPRLPDRPGTGGPMAGIRAAFGFHPDARWIILACDTPLLHGEALRWLLDQARLGVWAVLPRLAPDGPIDPLPGLYAPQAGQLLETVDGPSQLAGGPGVVSPVVPAHLAPAWSNLNTPDDVRRLTRRT